MAATMARGEHHRLVVVSSGQSVLATSRMLRFVLFLVCGFLPWIVRLGPVGLILLTLLTWLGLNFILFSQYLAQHKYFCNQKFEQIETKRNRRNMGMKHQIMQINPKIEPKSFKMPMHI